MTSLLVLVIFNMAASLPPVPASLKSVQHHLKTAQEHDARDPVVAYYCEKLFCIVVVMSRSAVV